MSVGSRPSLPAGYYAILDATPELLATPERLVERAEQLLDAHPGYLQLRAKAASARDLARASRLLLPVCRWAGVPFCVNDRLDVALAIGADAVHLGQDDLPLADALAVRARAGRAALCIGYSTHDRAQALAAAEGGADYIGFGPIFATASKQNPDPTVGLELLAAVCRAVRVPVVAIGGIGLGDVEGVASAGAAAAAIIAAVDRAADPTGAAKTVAGVFARRASGT
jgi:thiamine-phosphate pyrophosphorylase